MPTPHPLAAPAVHGLEREWARRFPELSRPAAPARTPAPRVLALDADLAADLGLDPASLRAEEGVRFLTGESAPADAPPVAQVYAGHQWGVFRPLLGDGRAALLGERRAAGDGRLREIHLKGIGPTSMSRVDGYATVGPMLREFALSASMHALGVPTTRALAVVATGAPRRLDGVELPGAVLARTASSHVRFGSFEYVRAQGDRALLARLADHVIERSHPSAADARHPHRALLAAVVDSTAALTAAWMSLGFVHGVLSTDNVLVSAETIDYGPCAFLDAYEPGAWFSSIDRDGRYAYERQPSIMRWNLERLGVAIAPLLAAGEDEGEGAAAEIVAGFDARYRSHRDAAFRAKLGLDDRTDGAVARALADAALALLDEHGVDFTGFWRDLAAAADGDERAVRARFLGPVPALDAWFAAWRAQVPRADRIRGANPVHIPRNHLVEEALDAAVDGDLGPFDALLEVLRHPFDERGADRRYALPAPAGSPRHRTFCGT
ncbi:protein adenylyltransferase SelO family protein [Microbacterium gilvum]|uniref:Protein nucleotidyltransferase YdiU n=1 Tax=Microbacterium gilvum TaxID=1336204 RepID=A0ABP8ZXW4_9MICO